MKIFSIFDARDKYYIGEHFQFSRWLSLPHATVEGLQHIAKQIILL